MNQTAFDREAKHYDERFTYSSIGVFQRARVYHWLEKINFFAESRKVFEINCGTGYDADQFVKQGHDVTATDGSKAMVEKAKAVRSSKIRFYQLGFRQLVDDSNFTHSDVLFSNFGGLNCLSADLLHKFLKQVASKQKKEDLLILVLMPKRCIVEDVYFLLKGKISQIGRRNSKQGIAVKVEGEAVETYYHSPKELETYLRDNYKITLVKPVAFLLPPSYLQPFFNRRKVLLGFLNNLEQLFGRFRALASWSDHYILIAERK